VPGVVHRGAATLTPLALASAHASDRRALLRDACACAEPGDVLLFFHRTSWRSRWIRRITGCDMPHACVYVGQGRIVGMLRGRVRRHPLRRFFRPGYDVRLVRGCRAVGDEVLRFAGSEESWLDLFVLGTLVLAERALGPRVSRRSIPWRMRGVTCSGIVSTAWHRAHALEPSIDPMKHTPLDLERAVGTCGVDPVPARASAPALPGEETPAPVA
jgi:hypothetical protein